MQCPVCDERMKEVERLGVSIDICPGCKGVWLDRGELEKLVALSRQGDPGGVAAPSGPDFLAQGYAGFGQGRHDHDHDRHREHDHPRYPTSNAHDRDSGHPQERRRGSWFGDIFGGDD